MPENDLFPVYFLFKMTHWWLRLILRWSVEGQTGRNKEIWTRRWRRRKRKRWLQSCENLFQVRRQQRLTMSEKIEKGWRRWKKKKTKQTNGILALSRTIREGYKRLPLISPDRSKPRPFHLTAKRQKRPKHTYTCIHQVHTHTHIYSLCHTECSQYQSPK